MRVFLLFILFTIGFSTVAKADHITGGEMYYRLVGFSNGSNQYVVTVKLFKNCYSNRQLLNPSIIGVFDRLTGNRIQDITVALSHTEKLSLTNPNKCITDPPDVCYEVGFYEFDVSLPPNSNGYTITCQVSFRVQGIDNLIYNYGSISATYAAEIPGNADAKNTSARFIGSDMVAVCANNSFSYSFAAQDDDGDELRYSLCNAFLGGSGGGASAAPPAPPPYLSVPYGSDYSGNAPLGSNVSINPKTGLIKGIAPGEGIYVITVCVQEVRNGMVIATQRKDLQLNIASCTIAAASLLPEYLLCKKTNTLSINNNSTSPLIKSYNWELINSKGVSVYTETNPALTYTFADTGLYKIKLAINKGLECSDSMESVARVYPGTVTEFDFYGICFKKPTQFINKSTTVYGQINLLSWDFGESTGSENKSSLQNPGFLYTGLGSKNAQLIIGTTKGCKDTLTKIVSIIEKPLLTLPFRDSLICINDKVQLLAEGKGDFSWTPLSILVNSNTANPIATPPATTTFFVTLDDNGCTNRDSLKIRVVNGVSLKAMNDTTICQGDVIQLKLTSDALAYSWVPAEQVGSSEIPNPFATTSATTSYEVIARIGGCVAKDQVVVTAVPYPKASAGIDTVICFNAPVQLSGTTNGASVSWSPASSLSKSSTINPIARPLQTTTYILSSFDNKGCPKPGKDSIVVTVLPPIIPFAGRDTAAVVGQPLQLNATGGVRYKWSPTYGLSADNIPNPVATYSSAMEDNLYRVNVFNEAGCVETASIVVKVFSTGPSVFVPTAFTPNGDGKNDKVLPVVVGMKAVEYFNIYNRWGQLVYSTPVNGIGWDGTIGGKVQRTETFIWVVKAIDYNNKAYFRKGTVTLIH